MGGVGSGGGVNSYSYQIQLQLRLHLLIRGKIRWYILRIKLNESKLSKTHEICSVSEASIKLGIKCPVSRLKN